MIEFCEANKENLILLAIGLVAAIGGLYRNYKIETIRKNGIKTIAHIVDYESKMKYTQVGNTSNFRTLYYPVVRFTDNNGTHRQVIDDSIGTSYKPSKKLPFELNIHYLENNGGFEMITENKLNDIFAMGIAIIGLGMITASLFFIFTK